MTDNRAMRRFRSFLATSLLVSSSVSFVVRAADVPDTSGFRERYPAATLDSIPKADAALAAAKTERSRVERDYRATARECMSRFLVNDCLIAARESQRKRLADIDAVEVDANRYKRRDRGEKSDATIAKREAERAANEKADAELRARNKSTYDARQGNAERDAERAGTRTPSKPRQAPLEKNAEAAAAQRAKNVDTHAEKIEDAAEHRKDLERRRAEKVAERKRRAAEKAAKAAASPATNPGTPPATAPATKSPAT